MNTTPPTDKRDDLEYEFGCLEILHNCAYGIGIRDADAIDNCVSAVRNVMLQSPPQEVLKAAVEALRLCRDRLCVNNASGDDSDDDVLTPANKAIAQLKQYVKGEL